VKLRSLARDLRSSGALSGVHWWSVTDVWGQHIGPIFKGQSVQLILEDGTPIGCPEMSVTNYQSNLINIPEERKSHRGGILKSRTRPAYPFVLSVKILFTTVLFFFH
jgi:hypothetical protein